MHSTAAAVLALGPDIQGTLESMGDVGFWVVVAIIFAECGLLIGFFLPGDSLLFITGLLIASGTIGMNIAAACLILFVAALVGNITGYWIGYKAGPSLFNRPNSRLFRQEYVDKTHAFFEKYGARAIILARFVPIVRTFITATAGIGRMPFGRYLTFSAIGGLLWAIGVTLAGYWLGNIEFVKKNIELILIGIVVVSVLPIVIEFIRHRRERSAARRHGDPAIRAHGRAAHVGGPRHHRRPIHDTEAAERRVAARHRRGPPEPGGHRGVAPPDRSDGDRPAGRGATHVCLVGTRGAADTYAIRRHVS
jgi:membrane-associated protein